MTECGAPYKTKEGRCDAEATYPDGRCGLHTFHGTCDDEREGTRYRDAHVGEKPVGWPNQRIAEHPDMWGADDIAENIEKCRGCSQSRGVCARHRGMMEGYGAAVRDMSRAFDLDKSDFEARMGDEDVE